MADAWRALADEIAGGAQEEFVRELTERFARMLAECEDNPDMLATYTRQVAREVAMGVWAEFRGPVTDACREAFEEALGAEDAAIVGSLEPEGALAESAASSGLSGGAASRLVVASRQVESIIERQNVMLLTLVERQNVMLAETCADRWWEVVGQAVTRLQLGEGRRSVAEWACGELARAGMQTVVYGSGGQATQRTSVDAAIRRHVITQQSQCRAALLEERMREWGHDLVYTSAHWGARPTHRPWQGRVFSLFGDTPGYETLADGTGYGTPGGLCGCNCRHRFYPYSPGRSKLPSTDFAAQETRFGMTSDEYYAATQRQRAMERGIRATKRAIALGQSQGQDMAAERYRLGRQQARLAAHVKSCGLTRDYSRERAYAVNEQPRALRSRGMSYTAFVESDKLSVAGVSEATFLRHVEAAGGKAAFRTMSPASQERVLTAAARETREREREERKRREEERKRADAERRKAEAEAAAEEKKRRRDAARAALEAVVTPEEARAYVKSEHQSKAVDVSRQNKHVRGTKEWGDVVSKNGGSITQSEITLTVEEISELVAGLVGTGDMIVKRSRPPQIKERVRIAGRIIGIYRDARGRSIETDTAIIHYSASGLHLVPARPLGDGK